MWRDFIQRVALLGRFFGLLELMLQPVGLLFQHIQRRAMVDDNLIQ